MDTCSQTSQSYLEVRFTSRAQWKSRVFTLTTATFTNTTLIADALQKRKTIYIHRAVPSPLQRKNALTTDLSKSNYEQNQISYLDDDQSSDNRL